MTDPRLTPDPDLITMDEPARINRPVVDLTRGADGPRDRQLLYGDDVTVLDRMEAHALVRARKDGYCGTVSNDCIGPVRQATHIVTARATHAYNAADFKSQDRVLLSFGSHLSALSETPTFIETELGFIPRQHVRASDALATDPAAIAEIFLGTPYLWGGNSCLGIDCSGLVQAAWLACGLPCPGDSDLQARQLGARLDEATPLRRNDLIFWKGHVALVMDDETLIHANAAHMSVVREPIAVAIERIERQGEGMPTGKRREASLAR
ncbi:MAG: NlpC/P60 family protein [Roseobacter sp.]|jgi:hypothetical protein